MASIADKHQSFFLFYLCIKLRDTLTRETQSALPNSFSAISLVQQRKCQPISPAFPIARMSVNALLRIRSSIDAVIWTSWIAAVWRKTRSCALIIARPSVRPVSPAYGHELALLRSCSKRVLSANEHCVLRHNPAGRGWRLFVCLFYQRV
jgi:hypothetical protein